MDLLYGLVFNERYFLLLQFSIERSMSINWIELIEELAKAQLVPTIDQN
jgi:hypothetical protein